MGRFGIEVQRWADVFVAFDREGREVTRGTTRMGTYQTAYGILYAAEMAARISRTR